MTGPWFIPVSRLLCCKLMDNIASTIVKLVTTIKIVKVVDIVKIVKIVKIIIDEENKNKLFKLKIYNFC